MISLTAEQVDLVRRLLRPGVLLSAHRGTRLENIQEDLQELRLVGDPRPFILGEADHGQLTYWPQGEMQHDHDCVVVLEYEGEAFYGS